MRWIAIFSVLAVLWAFPAQAQFDNTASGLVGYQYPNPPASTCSPTCTGVSATVKIPTFSGAGGSTTVYAWIGVATNTGDGSVCISSCLGQFGFVYDYTSGSGLGIWWELFCGHGGSGCGAATLVTGFTVNAGDTLHLQMVCMSNCTGSSSETWAVTLTDTTTGSVCYIHNATTCGSSGVTFNWPLSISNVVDVGLEPDDVITWAGVIQWSGLTYTTGLPGSQVVHNMPLTPKNNLWTKGNAGAASETFSASGPLGANQNDFNICPPVTSSIFNPCQASPYGPAPAMGPSL
jgi:hypothetical protein